MANPVSSVDVPLSLFSGWVTELSPPDIPEGASPQNNDVVYTPGAVATRSGLNRVFSIAIDSLGPISYEKSFVTPSGDIKNLYLTMQDGILWVEDVTNSPGTATQLFQSAGASYASSCTAQGREYIALSDGVHGADVPLIYDGTNLWRCSQDGPAVAPTVTSIALPTSTLQAASLGPFTVTSVVFNSPVTHGPITYYTGAAITLSSTVGIIVGTYISISGNTSTTVNDTVYVAQTTGGAGISVIQWSITPTSMTAATGTGGTAAVGASGNTLIRANNIVSGTTSTAHSLQPGYLAQITGGGTSQVGGGIVSIVLNNEDNPGIAVVTTTDPHGLLPQNQVNIQGVTGAVVGSAITNVAFAGDLVTITTSTPHKLSIGSEVLVAAVTNTTVNGQWTVVGVPTSTTFTYEFVSIVTAYSAADTGSVTYIWPLASTDPAENYFTVQTAPSPTTFTIQLSYTDGTWTGGTVSFGWDGQFFVLTTPSSTTFTYQQYGPNATTTAAATVTPYGQAAPGIHQCQVSYLFANDAISAPSPPATFVANGGQYLNVILPIGPSNVIGRIVQFTGAGGAFFFYIAVPAIVNGVLVSTATQINDNATINVLLDFSDNTLYGAGATPGAEGGAVSVPGNNLSAQLTLGPCAGFFTYASRVLAWGERNKIQNFLNLGFDADQSGINNPQGWTATGTADAGVTVSLTGRPPGCQWRMDCADSQVLSQSAYVDTFNAPILAPLTSYKIRLWLHASYVGSGGPNFIATFTSASTSYTSTATVLNSAMSTATQGAYIEAAFSLATPGTIPTDMLFNIANSVTGPAYSLQVDEIEIINIAEPYLDTTAKMSYVDNLTAFDANTGALGAEDDLSPIRNFGVIRQTLYMVTGTGLHLTEDNGQTEPADWGVDQVADNCGAFSIASVARNPQGIGAAGKDWMMWSGPDGAQIFTGQKPIKISQEIQSVWDAIPTSLQYRCWVKNYESAKWCFFGIPNSTSMQTLVLDYRNIDGAMIAENPPIHISFTGKMIVSDLTRKWTSWTIPAYCGELMYRANQPQPQIVFGCLTPANAANAYVLNAGQYYDDDFGVIPASYTTYFFVSHEMEQALQVGSHRHLYTLAQAFISGVGTWTLTPLAAALTNPFPASAAYPLSAEPNFDMDFGINVETTRCAFTIQAQPVSGNNSYFKLQKLVINMAKSAWLQTRGSATGAF